MGIALVCLPGRLDWHSHAAGLSTILSFGRETVIQFLKSLRKLVL